MNNFKIVDFKQYKDLPLVQFIAAYKLIVLGFLVSLTAVIVLSVTMLADAIYFNDPRHQDMALESWMTPHYIGLSYDLPREVVFDLLDIEEGKKHPRRLDRLAGRMGVSLDELTEMVRVTAAAYRSENND